jgi:hypothetical protein
MWFNPARSQLFCQVIHHSLICATFVSNPAPDSNDPVFAQLGDIELGEAPAARNAPDDEPSASLVALGLVRDLLVRAEHLFERAKTFGLMS